jgi:spermidine/putrescine transport system ATP-binding protein
MRSIRFESVKKGFSGEVVLKDLNLHIPAGQFFALLGPSGCGKTTILRLIAGLDAVDSGKIFLGSQDITDVPIYKRKVNTVFQQYALFSHLTVFENVAYSLKIKKFEYSEIKEKVYSILKVVRLSGHELKYPKNLSGGQQQRVALARALVNEPEVLLLDEPLAALDFKLKEQMLIELINLQDKFRTTFVYVTHDQFEALTVADQMAIMNMNGSIEQIGTPKQIYEFPKTCFVATFVGNTNLVKGALKIKNGVKLVEVDTIGDIFVYFPSDKPSFVLDKSVLMSIRPEKIFITKKEQSGFSNHVVGKVNDIIYYGRSTEYRICIERGHILTVFEQNEEHFPQETIDYDDKVHLYFQKENIVLLDC